MRGVGLLLQFSRCQILAGATADVLAERKLVSIAWAFSRHYAKRSTAADNKFITAVLPGIESF